MKKRILLLLLTLVLLTLTACGSKGESGSSDEKNAEIVRHNVLSWDCPAAFAARVMGTKTLPRCSRSPAKMRGRADRRTHAAPGCLPHILRYPHVCADRWRSRHARDRPSRSVRHRPRSPDGRYASACVPADSRCVPDRASCCRRCRVPCRQKDAEARRPRCPRRGIRTGVRASGKYRPHSSVRPRRFPQARPLHASSTRRASSSRR